MGIKHQFCNVCLHFLCDPFFHESELLGCPVMRTLDFATFSFWWRCGGIVAVMQKLLILSLFMLANGNEAAACDGAV
jgi:hypothetical protein